MIILDGVNGSGDCGRDVRDGDDDDGGGED
jgi:hypothetical protein